MDNIEVIDLKAKFIDFYEIANNKEITRDKRLDLWERKYNFAAVPPGEQGRKLARKLFEEAWDKYEENMDIIKNWRLDIEKIQHYLNMIKLQLGYEGCIDLVIIYFVGFFENNAFTAPYGEERIAICLPIETNTDDILLVHELTHVVHSKTANLSLEWERTIAEIILSEGLALHLSKTLVPGYSDESYTEFSNGWLKMCAERKNDIFNGIYPYLNDASADMVYLFTIGNGTTNIEREAYFVGWELVKDFIKTNVSFQELANIKNIDIPKFITESLKYS